MNSSAHNNKIAAIIVAAGDGTRLGGDVPKAYRMLGGKPLLAHSVQAFTVHPAIDRVLVVVNAVHAEWLGPVQQAFPAMQTTIGGASRQESVRKGLEAVVEQGITHVLIHDAARPFVSAALIDRMLAGLEKAEAVLPVVPVVDTIKGVENAQVTQTHNRDTLAAAQTPQGFAFPVIHALHQRFADKQATDDAMLAEWGGVPVLTVEGERANRKLTYEEDWKMAEQELAQVRMPRMGMGFDVHKLVPHDDHVPDRHRVVRICGVDIPCEMQLEGHSDADVGLHALTDAILGALCEGDIGLHFPPTEPKWRGADSSIFLLQAMNLLHQHQALLHHIDITLITKLPRISPHRDTMRKRIAELTGLPITAVSVKATTTEGLGFTGRGEGVAAQAVVTVLYPQVSAA